MFRLLPGQEKNNLFDNLATALARTSAPTMLRQLALFDRADAAYGAGVRRALVARGALDAAQ